jgi:hypothetical protein
MSPIITRTPGSRNIRQAVPDVSSPGLSVDWRNAVTNEFDNKLSHSVYRGVLASANVVDAGSITFRRQDIRLRHVFNKREVPALLVIAKSDGRFTIKNR